ncbi:acyl-coenzyme A synthetase/AMP-(fatty) acid ligase [Paraburkholderia sp. GAS32]
MMALRIYTPLSGGSNISPTEVEHALTVHRGVSEAAIVGVPDAGYYHASKYALDLAHKQLAAMFEDFDEWETLSRSTAFDEAG